MPETVQVAASETSQFAMSETVQIALITFLAGVASSFIAAYFGNRNSNKDRKFRSKELSYANKFEAYSAFFSAYHAFIGLVVSAADKRSIDRALNDLAEKYSFAALLAPNHIAEQMYDLFSLYTEYSQNKTNNQTVAAQYAVVRNALHDDLEKTKPN